MFMNHMKKRKTIVNNQLRFEKPFDDSGPEDDSAERDTDEDTEDASETEVCKQEEEFNEKKEQDFQKEFRRDLQRLQLLKVALITEADYSANTPPELDEMAFAGLRKQINKANQYVSEKIGGAEGTKLTEEYTNMEKKVDLTNDLVELLITQTKELLQPNPATRAKLSVNARLGGPTTTGGTASHAYPQPEGILGDSMVKFGTELGPESAFGKSLIETGEALRQLADIKYSLEDNVKQNFLEPLTQLQQKDLKDVMFHRKKLQGRRLDYDCKKRKRTTGGHVTDEEMRTGGEKFEESFNLASEGMFNLLENDVEQLSQLCALMEAFSEYHQQCAETLVQLTDKLQDLRHDASAKPKGSFEPKKLSDLDQQPIDTGRSPLPSPGGTGPGQHAGNMYLGNFNQQNKNSRSPNASPIPSPMRSPAPPSPSAPKKSNCQALYDFKAENPGELEFKEGDKIDLIRQIDANWFEGSVNGNTGFFPANYVEVLVPLP